MTHKVRMRIRHLWEGAGKEGFKIGPDFKGPDGMIWTPIIFDDEQAPEWVKARSLENGDK